MIWTDELVSEFVKEYFNNYDAQLLLKFKQSKSILPTNCIITLYSIDNICYDGKDENMSNIIANNIDNKLFNIMECEVNGCLFALDDIVYNSHNYKKYGGKWNSYAVKISSLNLRIKKDANDKIISSLLVINNFYDVSWFIKK